MAQSGRAEIVCSLSAVGGGHQARRCCLLSPEGTQIKVARGYC